MPSGVAWVVLFVLSGAPGASTLQELATRMYRAGRYTEACAMYQRAAAQDPKDASIQADLGLCLAKIDKREEAIAATRRAIDLGDRAVRKSAYYNLGKMGIRVQLPAKFDCAIFTAPGCDSLYACTYTFEAYGSGGGSWGVVTRLSLTEALTYVGKQEDLNPDSANGLESREASGNWLDLWLNQQSASTHPCIDLPPETMEACNEALNRDLSVLDCNVVHLDVCRRRIGIFCTLAEHKKTRSSSAELSLTKPRWTDSPSPR